MEPDLRDLLSAWLSDTDPGDERREALYHRLQADIDFRQQFVHEIHLLGLLKVVQSAEPRWLRLADLLGWSASNTTTEQRLADEVVRKGLARQRRRNRLRQLFAVSTVCLLLVLIGLVWYGRPEAGSTNTPGPEVARVLRLDQVVWGEDQTEYAEGDTVPVGRIQLQSGRVTLVFISNVRLTIEGPADIELLTFDQIYCHRGKLHAHVPTGGEGFTVKAPGYEVVDLGTEFGLNQEPGQKSQLMVFKGEAAVSLLDESGRSVRSQLLEGSAGVEVDPTTGQIRDVGLKPEQFVKQSTLFLPKLSLPTDYSQMILAAKPWGYWRFEQMIQEKIPNEIPDRPALQALGKVYLESCGQANRCVFFPIQSSPQDLLMEGFWEPTRKEGYAIEMWVCAFPLTIPGQTNSALVSLIALEDKLDEGHVSLLELTARTSGISSGSCAVRFLDRWPAAQHGGFNIFSRRTFDLERWHHLVGQKVGDKLELYIDGELAGTSPAGNTRKELESTIPCQLLIGRLKHRSTLTDIGQVRPFQGRLDELAIYDHPLSADEIRRHALWNR